MTLLAPWALWFTVLGGAVVALYLLKVKRKRATVPALEFWRELAGKTKVHSLFERLKRLLSLLLWMAIVAALVLALANPILSLGRVKPRAIAIVLDNSASMQAMEDGKSRWDRAREAIAEISSRRPVMDEWLLIEAAGEAKVRQGWTFDAAALRKAAAGAQGFGGVGDLKAGVELAAQLVDGKRDPCIVVVSDGAAGAIEDALKADSRLVYWPVGKTRDNLGVSKLAVRADRVHGNYLALLAVTNASDQKVETQVTLEIDGRSNSVELVTVEAGATWEKTVTIEPPGSGAAGGAGGMGVAGGGGAVLRAVLDRPDALAADNEAFAILEPIKPAVVWLVSDPETSFFFEQALGSMVPLIWPEESVTMSLGQYEEVAEAIASSAAAAGRRPDLVIFNDCSPKKLPGTGRFVLSNSTPPELPVVIKGELESPQILLSPRAHSITQHITLQGARLAKAVKVGLKEQARVLAHSADGDPLIVHVEQPDRQLVYLAFDVMDSDLPFRNAFPLLLRNIVAFLHEEASSEWLRPRYRIGEVIRPLKALPAGISTIQVGVLRGVQVKEEPVPVEAGGFAFTDTASPGAVRMSVGEDRAFASINLADAGESRIGPVASKENATEKLMLSRRFLGAMPWLGLTMLALLVISVEWMTYHLRWTE